MKHTAAVSIVVFLLFSAASSSHDHHFSRNAKRSNFLLLERLSKPYRERFRRFYQPLTSVVDFLASDAGLSFLAFHGETLWFQFLLEKEYNRDGLCRNMLTAEKRISTRLTREQERLRKCLCRRYLPFLHCLAIGSKLLRENGHGIGNGKGKGDLLSTVEETVIEPESHSVPSLNYHHIEDASFANASCLPRILRVDGEIVMPGRCVIPIAQLFDIKILGIASVGASSLRSLDVSACEYCRGGRTCRPLCKDDMDLAISAVEDEFALVRSSICYNLGFIGEFVSIVFGVERCFTDTLMTFYPHQRVVRYRRSYGLDNFRVTADLHYKFENGPHCTCQLQAFQCTDSCRMLDNDVAGTVMLEWDFFFIDFSRSIHFNDRQECYSRHSRPAPDCIAPPSYVT